VLLTSLFIHKNNLEAERIEFCFRQQVRNNIEYAIKKFKADRYYTPELKNELANILYGAETILGVKHKKILAHWMLESRMNPNATGYNYGSHDGGLGQINSRNFCWLPQRSIFYIKKMGLHKYVYLMRDVNIYNPITNAFMSISYMSMLQERYGKGWQSVISYNAGSPVYLVGVFKKYYKIYKNNFNNLI
jgi:hypothetical protein